MGSVLQKVLPFLQPGHA